MRELPILTNCGVSSFSNSALFKLRERRFSVRIRVIFSCSEREMTQLHILTRLDAEQHLRYEPSERLCQALTELRGKLRQLRFESGSNFAIVHRGTPPWWFGFLVKTLLPRNSSPPTSQSRQATDLSRVRLSVLQIFGETPANCLPPAHRYLRYPLLPTSDLSPLPNASRNEATTASRSWRSFVASSSFTHTTYRRASSTQT